MRDSAVRLFESGRGNDAPQVRGTLWAAYNGVTELADYHLENESPEARLRSIWFGAAAELKIRAYDAALSLLREERSPAVTPRRGLSLEFEREIETDLAVVGKEDKSNSNRELAACY